MAGRIGVAVEPVVYGQVMPWLSTDVRSYTEADYDPAFYDVRTQNASGTRDDYRPLESSRWAIEGERAHSFFLDYYFRIHVDPYELDMGNLISSQTVPIYVWNAYLVPKLLLSITGSGMEGSSLNDPNPPPTTYQALEERTYNLTISTNGPPVIEGELVWNFDGEGDYPHVEIFGRRVVVWPYMPLYNYKEQLEWKTDVIQTYEGEQRLALRVAPRQRFDHQYMLDERQYARMKVISTQWAHRVYGIPLYAEKTYVGTIALNATQILFNTANADYRDESMVAVIRDGQDPVAYEITDVLADRVILKYPMAEAITGAYVAPLRLARTLGGSEFVRIGAGLTRLGAAFDVVDNADLSASVGYPVYKGLPVVPQCPVMIGDMSDRIYRAIDVFDNGSGPMEVDNQFGYMSKTEVVTFSTYTRADRWKVRQFLHSLYGRQKAFWLPSHNPDLILVGDVGASSTDMIVESVDWALYMTSQYIAVDLKNGTRLYNFVISGTTDSVLGQDRLVLETSFGVPVNVADVSKLMFMRKSRLDTDVAELTHPFGETTQVALPTREVPA